MHLATEQCVVIGVLQLPMRPACRHPDELVPRAVAAKFTRLLLHHRFCRRSRAWRFRHQSTEKTYSPLNGGLSVPVQRADHESWEERKKSPAFQVPLPVEVKIHRRVHTSRDRLDHSDRRSGSRRPSNQLLPPGKHG